MPRPGPSRVFRSKTSTIPDSHSAARTSLCEANAAWTGAGDRRRRDGSETSGTLRESSCEDMGGGMFCVRNGVRRRLAASVMCERVSNGQSWCRRTAVDDSYRAGIHRWSAGGCQRIPSICTLDDFRCKIRRSAKMPPLHCHEHRLGVVRMIRSGSSGCHLTVVKRPGAESGPFGATISCLRYLQPSQHTLRDRLQEIYQ